MPVDLRHLVFELGDVWISLVIVPEDRIHRSRADIDMPSIEDAMTLAPAEVADTAALAQ